MSKTPIEPGDWSHESEALFRAARTVHAPTAADRARVRSALAQRFVASATPPARGETQASTSAGAGAAATGKLMKIGVGVACVVIGAVVFVRGSDLRESHDVKQHDQTPHATQTAPTLGENTQSVIAPSDAVQPHSSAALHPSDAPAPVPATPAQTRAVRSRSTPELAKRSPPIAPAPSETRSVAAAPELASRAPTSSPSAAPAQPRAVPAVTTGADTSDARAELAFMARINAAMVAAKANVVLALCAEHARRWPNGTFVQEREALRAIASCDSGSRDAAARARAFLTGYSRSSLAPRVRDECASLLGSEQ